MIKISISRIMALGLVFYLTACSTSSQYYTSQVIEPPAEKISELIIWELQGFDQDDGIISEYMPELVGFMEKNLNKQNIAIKRITTAKLSLRSPTDEVSELIQKTSITNVLKVYVTNISWDSDRRRYFAINVELINAKNNHKLWQVATGVGVGGNFSILLDKSIESVAAGLVNKMQADNALHPSFQGIDVSR